jgi:hypothetical protein
VTVYALLTEKQTFFDANSNELSGGKLFVYLAGTTTKATSYAETDGVSPNSNPIVLNSRGEVPNGLYVNGGATYKLVLAPSTDTDPPTSPIWTRDNLAAYNDISVTLSISEWITSTFVVSFSNGTTFTVPGDVTDTYQVNRRVRATIGSGNIYGRIDSSTFAVGVTTVVVTWDSGALDATLTAVDYALLAGANQSVPVPVNQLVRQSLTVSGTSGTEPFVVTSSTSGAEVAARLTVSDAGSGAGLKLGNSGLDKQISMRARSDGGITFYVNQASGGGTTSGTQGADLDASGYFNAVRISENATRTFSRNSAFVSATQVYTSVSQVMTFAHGLGAKPVAYDAFAVCNTIDNGYAVGDEIKITSLSSAIESVTVSCDTTNIYVAIKGGIPATDRTTPATYTALTANRWDVYVRAWY